MGMKQTFEIINGMEAGGVIGRYAVSGAVAAYNYIEPAVTEDLDILVSFDDGPGSGPGLISLEPVLAYLRDKGYSERPGFGSAGEGRQCRAYNSGWQVDNSPYLAARILGRDRIANWAAGMGDLLRPDWNFRSLHRIFLTR